MRTGMGWATFWPALAKIAVAAGCVWVGLEALDVVREISTK